MPISFCRQALLWPGIKHLASEKVRNWICSKRPSTSRIGLLQSIPQWLSLFCCYQIYLELKGDTKNIALVKTGCKCKYLPLPSMSAVKYWLLNLIHGISSGTDQAWLGSWAERPFEEVCNPGHCSVKKRHLCSWVSPHWNLNPWHSFCAKLKTASGKTKPFQTDKQKWLFPSRHSFLLYPLISLYITCNQMIWLRAIYDILAKLSHLFKIRT